MFKGQTIPNRDTIIRSLLNHTGNSRAERAARAHYRKHGDITEKHAQQIGASLMRHYKARGLKGQAAIAALEHDLANCELHQLYEALAAAPEAAWLLENAESLGLVEYVGEDRDGASPEWWTSAR